MKKTLFILFFCKTLFAQTIKVDYIEKKIVSKERLEKMNEFGADKEVLSPHLYRLLYSDGISFYKNDAETKNLERTRSDKKEQTSGENTEVNNITYRVTDKSFEKWYYKEVNNNLMLFNFYNANKEWFGKDKLVDWKWEITSENKSISGYNCTKAISHFGGMLFTAWFSDEIPINVGPEKFDGLPGLILYVGTPFFEWEATKITIEKEVTKIDKPIISEDTNTMAEVYSYGSNFVKNKKVGTETKTEGNTTITTTTTLIKD